MKILITNVSLAGYTGTETWTYTISRELARLGHTVHIMTESAGALAKECAEFATVRPRLYVNRGEKFQLALINHRVFVPFVSPYIFRVFTSHSAFAQICQFPTQGIDRYVAINEEVRMKKKGAVIIRNGIDTALFSPHRPLSKTLKNVFFLGNPATRPEAYEIVAKACAGKYRLTHIHEGIRNTHELINDNDLVITIGRGALEAMSCGRNVISADYRGYMRGFSGGGFIDGETFPLLETHNFTGRNALKVFDAHTLQKEMERYDPAVGEKLRARILQDYDVSQTAQQYLGLYGEFLRTH